MYWADSKVIRDTRMVSGLISRTGVVFKVIVFTGLMGWVIDSTGYIHIPFGPSILLWHLVFTSKIPYDLVAIAICGY